MAIFIFFAATAPAGLVAAQARPCFALRSGFATPAASGWVYRFDRLLARLFDDLDMENAGDNVFFNAVEQFGKHIEGRFFVCDQRILLRHSLQTDTFTQNVEVGKVTHPAAIQHFEHQ